MVLCGAAPSCSTQLDAMWASLVAYSAHFVRFQRDFNEFLALWAPFFGLMVDGLPVLKSGQN